MKNSNKFIFILFFILIASASAYLLANCIKRVPEGHFTIFKDKTTGDTKLLSPGIHFLIQGLYPDRIILRSFKNINNNIFNLKIEIPPFGLNNESLCIRMTCNVSYAVDNNIQIPDIQLENNNFFNDTIEGIIKANIKTELLPYITPYYKPESITNDKDKITEKALSRSKQQCKDMGLDIRKFELIGQMELPLKELYYNELKFLNELRDIEKNNKKELLILESKLLNEQKHNESYYNKLQEISKLIKENPDLLKYIYIEKLADNVKVILTSDKSGFPLGLTSDKIIERNINNNKIDNLK